ncbi:DoxX family protein [Streptomyces rhizosphaerihabitans]|uniref:DoxX family protein n=1 Tax=Streptomyces rhizosphaerihabitans TaxID=1266770 RepID=UPI0021C03F29|nr:DoxX family protein [Streptomyces rhizosphaerihabitans]MCT9005718.1 DoxX family protein [Streptomyces rhizosphaerihabitans]
MSEADIGLFALRLFLATLLVGHALQKTIGWFRGMGLNKTAEVFESWGFHPGRFQVGLAATCELLGATPLATGLLTRVGCATVIGTMIVAAAPNTVNGLWAHLGGCEVPVTYAAIAACLAFTGPGSISIDNAAGLPDAGALGAVAAIVIGVLAAVPPLLNRRRALRIHPSRSARPVEERD